MRKILIIGVGGIGSYLAPILHKTGLYEITIADPDDVEEKNLSYQNFEVNALDLNKVSALKNKTKCYNHYNDIGIRLGIQFPILTRKQIEGYDLVICCADNLDVRKLLYAEGFQEDCIDEDWKMEEFAWMGSIDYEEICKEVDDVNLWVHEEMPLNYAQLGKIFGFGRPFVENCSTPLYEGKMYPSSFAEIFEWVNDDNLIVCKDETVVPIPQKEFVVI
mgnify:CR=1 FL=1